ncbi:MAG: peptide chain release factor-like protein [Planctomycetota bacterium]
MEPFVFDKPVDREPHPAQLDPERLLKDVSLARGRSGGPGGQHRNKVSTHVELTHEPTGISASAGERREGEVNRKVALRRLRLALAIEYRMPVPAGDARSSLWRERCRDRKILCATKHADYPAMLAEALDFIHDAGFDVKKAAVRLDTSMSQLVKLIKEDKHAWAKLNTDREARGMSALK